MGVLIDNKRIEYIVIIIETNVFLPQVLATLDEFGYSV
jgi:hypothetical protein